MLHIRTSCGYNLRAVFVSFRASDSAATIQGWRLFEELRYSFGCESFMANRTGLGSTTLATLPGSMAKRTQTCTFELLAYIGKLISVDPGGWLSRHY